MTESQTMLQLNLSQLSKGKTAVIIGFSAHDARLETRLREIGFAEGDHVSLQHKGLFGGNPISVSLNGSLIALRKQDASAVLVRDAEAEI